MWENKALCEVAFIFAASENITFSPWGCKVSMKSPETKRQPIWYLKKLLFQWKKYTQTPFKNQEHVQFPNRYPLHTLACIHLTARQTVGLWYQIAQGKVSHPPRQELGQVELHGLLTESLGPIHKFLTNPKARQDSPVGHNAPTGGANHAKPACRVPQ